MTQNAFSPFDMDFTKMFADFKAPLMNWETVVQTHKRNVETLSEANRKAFETLQTVMKRNTESMQAALAKATDMMNQLVNEGTPEEKVVRQADMLKDAFESNLANAKELADLLVRSNSEYAELIAGRVTEIMSEIKDMVEKARSGRAAA